MNLPVQSDLQNAWYAHAPTHGHSATNRDAPSQSTCGDITDTWFDYSGASLPEEAPPAPTTVVTGPCAEDIAVNANGRAPITDEKVDQPLSSSPRADDDPASAQFDDDRVSSPSPSPPTDLAMAEHTASPIPSIASGTIPELSSGIHSGEPETNDTNMSNQSPTSGRNYCPEGQTFLEQSPVDEEAGRSDSVRGPGGLSQVNIDQTQPLSKSALTAPSPELHPAQLSLTPGFPPSPSSLTGTKRKREDDNTSLSTLATEPKKALEPEAKRKRIPRNPTEVDPSQPKEIFQFCTGQPKLPSEAGQAASSTGLPTSPHSFQASPAPQSSPFPLTTILPEYKPRRHIRFDPSKLLKPKKTDGITIVHYTGEQTKEYM
ncbi:hypothetical protein CPB84DRAFT_178607 [Gymnopilus junonius]|uniref:Uncharacterized protein n=1 Tax=Gymnopilus junonius TaxID=109634 RepID=A0A9P5NDI8_GYMJU|nr:hypothetical protein CPB84DRAFT_178607 [Gymnopilus junonius]